MFAARRAATSRFGAVHNWHNPRVIARRIIGIGSTVTKNPSLGDNIHGPPDCVATNRTPACAASIRVQRRRFRGNARIADYTPLAASGI